MLNRKRTLGITTVCLALIAVLSSLTLRVPRAIAQERAIVDTRLCEEDSRCFGGSCVFSPGDRCAPFGTGGCTSC